MTLYTLICHMVWSDTKRRENVCNWAKLLSFGKQRWQICGGSISCSWIFSATNNLLTGIKSLWSSMNNRDTFNFFKCIQRWKCEVFLKKERDWKCITMVFYDSDLHESCNFLWMIVPLKVKCFPDSSRPDLQCKSVSRSSQSEQIHKPTCNINY